MNLREKTGVALISLAFVIAPFGYWLSYRRILIGLAVFVPGCLLYFSARFARNEPALKDIAATDVHPSRELKGFGGAGHFDSADDE